MVSPCCQRLPQARPDGPRDLVLTPLELIDKIAEKILDHIGEATQPPRIAPVRGPPLWEAVAGVQPAGTQRRRF